MNTENATKARIEKSEYRKSYCINHRYMSRSALAMVLRISERQVARYLAPTKVYKQRQQHQKSITQQMILDGMSCKEVRNNLPISQRQYYYYKNLIV